jgi:uncharacterized membrane protein YkoI
MIPATINKQTMKLKNTISSLVAAGVIAAALTACTSPNAKEAKISKAEATKLALSKVPHGTIKESELEKEKGKLIWSFDIATPGTKNITEVNIDAITGAVIAVDIETPEKEKAEEKDEKK